MFSMLRSKVLMGLALVAVTAGSLLMVQTYRVWNLKDKNRTLSDNVQFLRQTILLTEKLVKDNENLNDERDDVLQELRRSAGRDTPLPSDIRNAIERMRQKPQPRPERRSK